MKKIVFLLLSVFFTLPDISFAGHVNWGPCKSAVKEYCQDKTAGETDTVISCLSRNNRHLSLACDNHLDKVKDKRKLEKKYVRDHVLECKAEEKKFCSGVKPGNGRLKACLRLHKHQLSNKCREALKDKSLFY